MLKDNLYKIIAADHSDGLIHAVIELNSGNEIFKGHFPERPILPGACMLQMVKEVFEDMTRRAYQLAKADDLKFLLLIDPQLNDTLQLQINYAVEETGTRVNASIDISEGIAFKMRGIFIPMS